MNDFLRKILLTPNQTGLGVFFFSVLIICVCCYVVFLAVSSVKRVTIATKIKFSGIGFSLLLILISALTLDEKYSWTKKCALILIYLSVFGILFTISILSQSKKFKPDIAEDKKVTWQFPEPAVSSGVQVVDKEDVDKEEVDFLHVKNVIERLKHYPLTLTEKKQTASLLALIDWVEKEGQGASRREEINEKLSELLKIMAKYGV